MLELNSGIFGEDDSQVLNSFVSTDCKPELDLTRRLVDVEHGHVDGLWNIESQSLGQVQSKMLCLAAR